ncbi:unnamed protein product, partial [marine sediment metagenome]
GEWPMGEKVIKVSDIEDFIAQFAFECDPEGPVIPPDPPVGLFRLGSPLPEPLNQHRLSQDFALRPESAAYKNIGGHDGLDWAVVEGTPLYASHDGEVRVAGIRFDGDPYGDQVRISTDAKDHLDILRDWTTIYAHMLRIDVSVGDIIKKGDQIGLS